MFHLQFRGRASARVLFTATGLALAMAGAAAGVLIPSRAMASEPTAQQTQPAAFRSDRLSVEVVGRGPDVVLMPGLSSSREVWRALATRLSATHRVHLVQLAGFAGEPWSHGDGPFVAPEVAELARYIREQGLYHPAVIGHSMGGLSGLMLAQTHPELVGRLMTVDALPFYSAMFGPEITAEQARPFADRASAMLLGADAESFEAQQKQTAVALARDPATQAAMLKWSLATDRHAMAAAMRDVMVTDLRPGLAAMTTPVTAVYAVDANGGAPAPLADSMWASQYQGLPGVKLERVENSRHFIMADEPVRFDELVDGFLK